MMWTDLVCCPARALNDPRRLREQARRRQSSEQRPVSAIRIRTEANIGSGFRTRATVFHKPDDYDAFLDLMAESSVRTPMRILAYCLMPNHFHLALWPREDGDVSRWMHWLMTTHVRRHLGRYRSSGHVWQGRFKAFPIQEDDHLLAVLRYIERNPLRAGLVGRAEEWRWSSLCWLSAPEQGPVRLEPGTVPRGTLWVEGVWFCLDACQRRGTERQF